MNPVVLERRSILLEYVSYSDLGLEIGAYDLPTLAGLDANIRYFDYQCRADLIKNLANPDNAEDIPEIDYVSTSSDFHKEIEDKFEYIVANHVIEHVPNVIKWLQSLQSMLLPGGILFLAVPDRNYIFDKYRSCTQLSHLISDYVNNIEKIPLEHHIEVELYYDMKFVDKPMDIDERLDWSRIERLVANGPHPGIHNHVFESETLLSHIVKPLIKMGFLSFNVVRFIPATETLAKEMILILRKERPRVSLTAEEFFTSRHG